MEPNARGFMTGLELSGRFYREAVEPLLVRYFGALDHAAARLGTGSEVLGFDTERSTDHDWGPRLQLFLPDETADRLAPQISAMLAEKLPKSFLGYPTNFTGGGGLVLHMTPADGPIRHGVVVAGVGAWLTGHLGFDPRGASGAGAGDGAGDGPEGVPVSAFDWLATPTQTLAEVTLGAVFHDAPGDLTRARAHLGWYPADLWRYVLASGWQRIAEEEAFPGRAGEAGDELGSAVVAARLVRDLMRLVLLMNRQYPLYSKWLGSAFSRLPDGERLTPTLRGALAATSWREREAYLVAAYEDIAAIQNRLRLCEEVDPRARTYHGRPFQVLHAERFANALRSEIASTALRSLPLVGAVDQWADHPALLGDVQRRRAVMRAVLLLDGAADPSQMLAK